MATKRKPAKKSRKTAAKKAKPTKKLVKKAKSSRKSAARNKPARSKAPAKTKRPAKKASSAKKTSAKKASSRQSRPQQRPARSARPFSRDLRGPDSAGQSGDLQGLSNRERADSESVDELLEEGNSFEAGVVEGVEEADENEGSEVHTHEVPEDDVPGEYLDED